MIARVALLVMTVGTLAFPSPREFSIDLWDWTPPCRDLEQFERWTRDMKSIGVTRVEISAPWNLLEPSPGKHDLSFIADRLAIAKRHGLGLRVRLNTYYNGATPGWYAGDRWLDIDGKPPVGTPQPVSLCDERFWASFERLCTQVAQRFRGEDVYFSPFLGIHSELKWSDWWSYDAATLARWRQVVRDRPAWLRDVAGEAPLPDVPPVPAPTSGVPDNAPVSRAWIAFREQVWRDAMSRFAGALRAGDSAARVSAPLGESFRRQSAPMSNLDYFGLTRVADQVVHSYDFFWHPKDDAWQAGAAVASFRGITGIDNIAFEFDGPALVQSLGYEPAQLLLIAEAAVAQGAGMKFANYSYSDTLPATYPLLKRMGELLSTAERPTLSPSSHTTLLFLSKWANYCYREKDEWLHAAQFGAWHMLTSAGLNVRIVCEDNLDEDLAGYQSVYVAFSPPELLPTTARTKLESLCRAIPSIVELEQAPARAPGANDGPLANRWLRGDRAACRDELAEVVRTLTRSGP